MTETNILIIPIAIIVASFLIRWYATFVNTQQAKRDRRLRAIQIEWLYQCYSVKSYSVNQVERLNRILYKQTMDEL